MEGFLESSRTQEADFFRAETAGIGKQAYSIIQNNCIAGGGIEVVDEKVLISDWNKKYL